MRKRLFSPFSPWFAWHLLASCRRYAHNGFTDTANPDLTASANDCRSLSVTDAPPSMATRRPDLYVATEGEFAGWRTWTRDTFESSNGPFWHKIEDDGRVRCAFRVEEKHLNGMRAVHGGCYMTFADYCLFAIASKELQGPAVTVSFSCEFLDAAFAGELIECDGEVTRAGGSLLFVRGMLRSGERKLFSFSGTIKRVKRKSPEATDAH